MFCNAQRFKLKMPQGLLLLISYLFQIENKAYTCPLKGTRRMACIPFEKARWGKDGGPGGKETPLRAS